MDFEDVYADATFEADMYMDKKKRGILPLFLDICSTLMI